VTSQHHVEVLARALPPVLKCCGVVRRQPGGGPTPWARPKFLIKCRAS